MADEQCGRRPNKKGGNKKQDNQPKPRRASTWDLSVKARNVKRHLAQDAKRAEKAGKVKTPHGTARLERRRLERLAAVELELMSGLAVFEPPEESPAE